MLEKKESAHCDHTDMTALLGVLLHPFTWEWLSSDQIVYSTEFSKLITTMWSVRAPFCMSMWQKLIVLYGSHFSDCKTEVWGVNIEHYRQIRLKNKCHNLCRLIIWFPLLLVYDYVSSIRLAIDCSNFRRPPEREVINCFLHPWSQHGWGTLNCQLLCLDSPGPT